MRLIFCCESPVWSLMKWIYLYKWEAFDEMYLCFMFELKYDKVLDLVVTSGGQWQETCISYSYTRSVASNAFPIAILAQLLPKFLITKEVCSKLTSIVFPRIPYLVPALAQNFCMLHVAMYWQEISVSCKMTNLEIFYAKAPNSGNLSHFHGTRTLILSWMHVKHMPGNGPRKRMSSSTLFPNGLSRSVKW